MDKDITLNFQLRSISISNLSVKIQEHYIKSLTDKKREHTFEVKCENKGLVKDDLMFVIVTIKIFSDEDKKPESFLGEIEVVNTFTIPNLDTYLMKKENILDLPLVLEYELVSISLSHARAVMYLKFANTILHDALMPIFNPMQFIKKKENVQEQPNI